MRFRGRPFLVERSRETAAVNLATGVPFESVRFTAVGRDTKVLEELLLEARALSAAVFEEQVVVYKAKAYMWEQFGQPRRKRPLASVVLPEGETEAVVEDVARFKAAAEWYAQRGIPYRRAYLFHGPPGCGKTSFITGHILFLNFLEQTKPKTALAGHFNHNIAVVSLTENITDDQFAQAMSCVPKDAVVLMEDVDAVFASRRPRDADGFRHGLSFSGLLNVLDGVVSSEERLTFLTTNHVERLDPALVRPGRVDVIRRFGPATAATAEEMFLRFFPGLSEAARRFGERGQGRSMAELQGVLMLCRDDESQCLAVLGEMSKVSKGVWFFV